jgi:hypothetical protein
MPIHILGSVQTLAPKRRMAIFCLVAEGTNNTRFDLWLGPSYLWMNKVLCLSGCFGPSESGNPLSESPHSYPIRWPLSVGPLPTWEGKKGHATQFVLAMKLSPRRGAKGAIGAASPHGLQKSERDLKRKGAALAFAPTLKNLDLLLQSSCKAGQPGL